MITQKSHRNYIRREIKRELVKHEILKFSKTDIKSGKIHIRYVKDDEIKVNNSMYDIVFVNETQDSLFITCINDKEEEKLIEKYIEKEKDSDSKSKHSMLKNLKPFSVFVLHESKENPEFYTIRILMNENGPYFYKSIITDVLSPPPEAI